MKIIDNFLPPLEFSLLQNVLMGEDFPWFYNPYTLYPSQGNQKIYQFTSSLFKDGDLCYQFPALKTCLRKLNVKEIFRIKVNLNPRTVFHRNTGYHTDGWSNITTAVYYINTNNGWTHIKGHGKVKSVANRIVIFDSNLEHAGFTCTDENTRVTVNFNYA